MGVPLRGIAQSKATGELQPIPPRQIDDLGLWGILVRGERGQFFPEAFSYRR